MKSDMCRIPNTRAAHGQHGFLFWTAQTPDTAQGVVQWPVVFAVTLTCATVPRRSLSFYLCSGHRSRSHCCRLEQMGSLWIIRYLENNMVALLSLLLSIYVKVLFIPVK